jgi:hypothetical protein
MFLDLLCLNADKLEPGLASLIVAEIDCRRGAKFNDLEDCRITLPFQPIVSIRSKASRTFFGAKRGQVEEKDQGFGEAFSFRVHVRRSDRTLTTRIGLAFHPFQDRRYGVPEKACH